MVAATRDFLEREVKFVQATLATGFEVAPNRRWFSRES